MLHDQFDFFLRTVYPQDYASMAAKYPDQPIEDLWPEQWACFQHMDATFQELIAENTKLDRERNEYRNRARKYAQKVYAIESLFVVPSDNHELTLKAIKTIVERVGGGV